MEAKIYSIHDSWVLHPNYIPFLQNLTNEGLQIIQDYAKNLPELKHFHDKGTIAIISKNIVKIDG